jgi:crotonobetainyl-CoA:carnitine CoA-transferase CaiB-like acyl-CoA transferase
VPGARLQHEGAKQMSEQLPGDASALDGIRVVDLTIARAGPATVRLLTEWGATAVRVESPGDGGGIAGDHTSSDFINLHPNKRLINLDLKSQAGRDILHRLLSTADVLVENFRPQVKKRLGIDYTEIAEQFPRLVYGSISGFGQDGPLSENGAVDQVIQGMSGLMSITGEPDGPPLRAGIAVADMSAGLLLANGIVMALLERERSGQGQWVRVSLLEALLSMLDFQAARWTVDHEVPARAGNDHPTIAPMGTVPTSDGFLNIAAPNDRLFERLVRAMGSPVELQGPEYASVPSRNAHKAQLKAVLERLFATRSRAEWVAALDAEGVPCGPVHTVEEAFAHPQTQHLGMLSRVEHPSRGPVEILRSPLSMSRSRATPKMASPTAGQHTDAILVELGLSEAEIATLRSDGVV